MAYPNNVSTKEEIVKYKQDLKELLDRCGRKVYCLIRHVSRSGMSRHIDFYAFEPNTPEQIKNGCGLIYKHWLSYRIAAVLDYPFNKNRECVRVSGCGMDMGFSVVYGLSRTLYPGGDKKTVIGRNGDKEPETDGGYLLKHEWL